MIKWQTRMSESAEGLMSKSVQGGRGGKVIAALWL